MVLLAVLRRLLHQYAPILYCLVLLLGLWVLASAQTPRRISQVQTTRTFLVAILHGKYAQAYTLLAPESKHTMTPAQFRELAKQLFVQGQRHTPAISLYKLGIRLGEQGQARRFYDFSFKSDTLYPRPQVLLDVTFRDSTATQIFSFGQIPALQKK